jgi:hypothetical protein
MAWQAPWRKEHHVDPYVVARAGEARAQHFSGGGDAAQAVLVNRKVEVGGAVAPFDLDESDNAPAPRDEVDLADGDAQPFTDDAPAVKAQPPRRAAFGAASACFGGGAAQACSFSVSARA